MAALGELQHREAQAMLLAGARPVDVVAAVVAAFPELSHEAAANELLVAGVRGLLPFRACSCGAFCGGKGCSAKRR